MSAKTKNRIGFWNVRTMYETGKLAQVTAEMSIYNLELVRADGQAQVGIEPAQERWWYTVVETTINTMRESLSS